MRILGLLFTIISGMTILVNLGTSAENEKIARESPFTTLLSGGSNLKEAYTFAPPFTGFEVFILILGVLGIALMVFGGKKKA